jgi:hypothetical protein
VGLADDLAAAPRRTGRLKVDDLLDTLDKADADALRHALTDPLVGTHTIKRACAENGIQLGATAIDVWRRENGVRRGAG